MRYFLLALLCLSASADAWITAYGFRELVEALHATPNQSAVVVQEALRLTLTKTEAVRALNRRVEAQAGGKSTGRALRNRAAKGRDDEDEEEDEEEESSTSTTTTARFNDPNFIPGEYLDASGEAKFVQPKPFLDVLTDFMAEIDKRQDVLWQVGVYILLDWMLQAMFIILAAWVTGLFVPMYIVTQKMGETLPMEDEDRVDKMLELAAMYEENPIRFAHLPGFQIPGFDPLSSDDEDDKDKGKKKSDKKKPSKKRKKIPLARKKK